MNMSQLPCRLCLDHKLQKIDIFGHTNDANISIENSIRKLFALKVKSSDKLKTICIHCFHLVNEFSEFHTLVTNTQVYLDRTITIEDESVRLASRLQTSENNIVVGVDCIKIDKSELNYEINFSDDAKIINNSHIKEEPFNKNKEKLNNISKKINNTSSDVVQSTNGSKVEEIYCNSSFENNNIYSERWNYTHNTNASIDLSNCLTSNMRCNMMNNTLTSSRSQSISEGNCILIKKTFDNNECTDTIDQNDDVMDDRLLNEIFEENSSLPTEVMKDGQFILKGYRLHDLVAKFYKLHCELCTNGQKFTNFYQMCKHYKTAHNTKGYVTCCEKKFNRWDETRCHMVYHLQPSALQCSICKFNGPTITSMRNHMRRHIPESEKIYKCDECGEGCSDVISLKQHKRKHLSYEEKHPYKCELCDKSFDKYALKLHKAHVHTDKAGDYLCPTCGRDFHNKTAMEYHLSSHDVHGGSSVKCKECDMILKNRFTLKQHMKQHGEKLKQCSMCDFSTYRTGPLNVHIKVKHSDIKPHECSHCGKRFKLKQCLDSHLVQHTGEKKFPCVYCPKTFSCSGNRSVHRRRMHLEEYTRDAKLKQTNKMCRDL